MKIVENWRNLWRSFSVLAMSLSTAVLMTWGLMPDDLKVGIPEGWIRYLAGGVLVLGVAGRYIKQDKVSGE